MPRKVAVLVARVGIGIAMLGCAPAAPASRSTVVDIGASSTPMPALSANAPADLSKAVVAVSLVTPSGDGFWGNVAFPTPDLSKLVRPCYEATLRLNPHVAGWLYVDLNGSTHESKMGDASSLPSALVECIARELGKSDMPLSLGLDRYSVYVSLSPD